MASKSSCGQADRHHTADVQVETLYKAVVAVKIFREDPWGERIAAGTVLDVEVREPGTRHAITLGSGRAMAGGGR